MKTNYLSILLFFFALSGNAQNLVINEVMADNESAVFDQEGDFPDWIELYNDETEAIDLQGFFLSDDEDEIDKWAFPSVSIPAKGFLMVFASGKDDLIGGEVHTNFKVSASGEVLLLSDPSNNILDNLLTENMAADQSHGRLPDGSQNFVPLSAYSPAASNNVADYLLISRKGGFYEKPFYVQIESALGDSVFCTTDGKLPTRDDVWIKDSLLIMDRNSEANYFALFPSSTDGDDLSYHGWLSPNEVVDKATPLRCASFRNGQMQSDVFNHTYFVDEEIFEKHTLPVISLVTEEANLFDDEIGIYVPGDSFEIDKPEWTGNFFETGREWERPVHISYFHESGDLEFEQNAGVRIHGGKSRQAAQKTLRLYAREEYGQERFEYPLLPLKDQEEYKVFLLETSMKAWGGETIIKDQLAAHIVRDFDIEFVDYQPVTVFVNGEYWGIHTIRDRPDERYLEELYDLPDRDSLDIVQNGDWYLTSSRALRDYNELMDYVMTHDLAEASHYDFVKTKMDISNYVDYTIAELFMANRDWPGNNMRIWKYGKNGKWRWIFFDLDGGLQREDHNMMEQATSDDPDVSWPNPAHSTRLFRQLLKNDSFVDLFLEKSEEYLESTFQSQRTSALLEEMKAQYAPQLSAHIGRWGFPRSVDGWEEDIESEIENFLTKRPCFFVEHLNNFFPDHHVDLDCDVNTTDTLPISNRFQIAPNPNDGFTFFINSFGVDLEGTFSVFTADGKLILQEELFLLARAKKTMLFPDLMNGLYFVVFETGQGVFNHKMLVGKK